jgi:hypothetical protein
MVGPADRFRSATTDDWAQWAGIREKETSPCPSLYCLLALRHSAKYLSRFSTTIPCEPDCVTSPLLEQLRWGVRATTLGKTHTFSNLHDARPRIFFFVVVTFMVISVAVTQGESSMPQPYFQAPHDQYLEGGQRKKCLRACAISSSTPALTEPFCECSWGRRAPRRRCCCRLNLFEGQRGGALDNVRGFGISGGVVIPVMGHWVSRDLCVKGNGGLYLL